MISLYRWNPEQRKGHWLDTEALRTQVAELRACSDVIWIDLEAPTEEEEQLVFQQFHPVHALTLEDIVRLRREPKSPPHFPKVEEFPDYLFVIVNPLQPRFLSAVLESTAVTYENHANTQLSTIITSRTLVTHHYEPVQAVSQLRAFLDRHDQGASRGPDYLFHLILDGMVDQYAPVLDHLDESLDALEIKVLEQTRPVLLRRMLVLKRRIIALRKTLTYEREILARLCRGEFALIDEREMVYYRNVYDHLVRFTELIESSRDMVSDLMQMHLSAMSNRLNEVMKVLTMISTIVLPMTLVAGIYGMNFKHMPELEARWGYPMALGIMLLTGVSSFLFFRWRKWI